MRIRKPGGLLVVVFSIVISFVKSQSDPCLDGVQEDASRLKLPLQYANLTPPWQRTDGKLAKVTRSEGLTYHWSWMKALQVKGFAWNVEDVIGFLNENHCLFVPVGAFVRSILLSQKTVYISGEVSCELHELFPKCVSKYGSHGCSLYPIDDGGWGAFRLEIGDASSNGSTYSVQAEPIVLYEWRSVIGAPNDHWRFTVDALAMYDDGAGSHFVIDPTGVGFKDVCDKKLAPASNDWEDWSKNQPMKVLGFYDLRADGFAPQSDAFQTFVNEKIEKTEKRVAQQFYCEHVLKGVANLEGSTPVCHTTYPEKVVAKKIGQTRSVMINEMGLTWNSTIGKAADDLEAVFCTARQFVDIRARLLHKITSSANHSAPEPPKVIEEGRPMVNDSAQVHSRPILQMSESAPELPPEYPNSPRAHPNEQLEFVEPPVEGGGSAPVVTFIGGHSEDAISTNVEPIHPIDDVDDEDVSPNRHEEGVPVAENQDFSDHNSMNNNNGLPVMKFDKVEDGDREMSDMAAAMEVSMSSNRRILMNLFIMLVIVFYH